MADGQENNAEHTKRIVYNINKLSGVCAIELIRVGASAGSGKRAKIRSIPQLNECECSIFVGATNMVVPVHWWMCVRFNRNQMCLTRFFCSTNPSLDPFFHSCTSPVNGFSHRNATNRVNTGNNHTKNEIFFSGNEQTMRMAHKILELNALILANLCFPTFRFAGQCHGQNNKQQYNGVMYDLAGIFHRIHLVGGLAFALPMQRPSVLMCIQQATWLLLDFFGFIGYTRNRCF